MQVCEVLAPEASLAREQIVQILPGVDSGVVPIAEHDADCVVAHRLELLYPHVLLAGLQDPLGIAVPSDFSGRGVDAQKLCRE